MTKLLVVDDEKNIRRLYETELTRDGYDVTTAESAEEALEALEKSEPDLVVLDIRLEGMDGIDCLRSIMETRRDLPVILNSAYSTYKQDFASWMADATTSREYHFLSAGTTYQGAWRVAVARIMPS